MKKFVKYILIFCAVLATTGCNFLDQDPEDLNSIEKVFSNKTDTRKWFARIYSDDYFPKEMAGSAYYNHYMFGHDDANNALDWHIPVVLQGMISPQQTTGAWTDKYYFGEFFKAIRHCNIFLENVEQCTELGVVDKNRMIAEARFMRAMYHFWILREYGPIPIMDHSVQSEDAGMKIARKTLEECVKFIIDEIDAAIPDMYETRSEEDFGFPTQGAALAMKSRILLTVASPLYNGNKTYANWRNNDGTVLMPMEYDKEKWKLAAEAAKAVIDLPQYKLLTPEPKEEGEPLTFQDYVDNYRAITTTYNDELIWACPQSTDWWCQQCWPAVFYSWNARDAVTLNLANAYYMSDGSMAKPLEEWFEDKQWSTKDDFEHGTQKNTFMMFVGREPRFYASNHFPNQYVSYATNTNPDVWQTIEFWYEGNSGLSKSSGDHNSTGLSPRKNIPLDATSDAGEGKYSARYIPFPIIRLGEIYLNYCEAMNEYYGEECHAEILPYLRAIRERAGIGVGVIEGENANVDQLLTRNLSQEEMREILRNERRVELAWETNRYFDVRRWFIAHGVEGVLNTPVYGLDVSQGKHATDPAFFTMKEGIPRTFRIEHYFAPISATECAFNGELIQAPFY